MLYLDQIDPRCIARFKSQLVELPNGCIKHSPNGNPTTHGAVGVRRDVAGSVVWRTMTVVTLSRLIADGYVDKEHKVYRQCGTKHCCNPDHYQGAPGLQPKETEESAFWGNTHRNEVTGCLIWLGVPTRNKDGFPTYFTVYRRERMTIGRVAWMITTGVHPRRARVHRVCGNPACVNPDHLELR